MKNKYINAKHCPFCQHHINANESGDYYCPMCDLSFAITPMSEYMYPGYIKTDEDVVKVKHGEWIELPNGWDGIDEYLRFECSECRREVFNNFPLCPYCGADMRGRENET